MGGVSGVVVLEVKGVGTRGSEGEGGGVLPGAGA